MSGAMSEKRTWIVGADHGGVELKAVLIERLQAWGQAVEDAGTDSAASVDYPDFAAKVAEGVASGRADLGLLVCGTGIGMSIKANRYAGVRAALCTTSYMARMARAHNDANVLCLGGRVLGAGQAEDILRAFMDGAFEGGRHARRIAKFDP